MNNNPNESIDSLYVLKAICALFVVVLHAPLGIITDCIRSIAGTAVPLFFMITGYFLYSLDSHEIVSRTFKTAKKALILWVICNLLYYPINPISENFSKSYMLYFKWLFLGMPPAAGHLWYLMALAQACIIIGIIHHIKLGKYYPYLILLWFFGFIFDDYRPIIFGTEASILSSNFLVKALPCVSAGMLVSEYRKRLLSFNRWQYMLLGNLILLYTNIFWLKELLPRHIILHPFILSALIITVFLTCLQYSHWGKNTFASYIGKKLSGNIYYWHGLCIMLFTRVLTQYNDIYETYGSILIFAISLALSYIIVKAQDKLGWNIIR